MDIFTTQLARVVAVPIKPASLKVKALLKDAANSKLGQDAEHLENHEYYFTSDEDEYHGSGQSAKQASNAGTEQSSELVAEENDEKTKHNNKGTSKHLDLYA